MPFKKGKSGNPTGRPLGAKNKSYLDANLWLSLAYEDTQKLKDQHKRFMIIQWATNLIMSKVPMLPATPGDSLDNAIAAQALIKALETDAQSADPQPVPTSNGNQ